MARRNPTHNDPLAERLERLSARLLQTSKPIIWLRATAGTGKTRLLRSLSHHSQARRFARWTLFDGEYLEGFADELTERASMDGHSRPKMIVATRPGSPLEPLFAKPNAYGLLELIGDADFFLSARECHSTGIRGLYEQTGGWAMLVDACVTGRGGSTREVLPDFLEREVLPRLPRSTVTSLFAAVCEPLPRSTFEQLYGHEPLHPLLTVRSDRILAAGAWVQEALLKLLRRPGFTQRAAMDDLNQVYASGANPVQAIQSLVKIGRKEQALDVFDRAGGMYFGYRHGFHALETVLQSAGPGWSRRRESSTFAHLWLLIKKGRGREARRQLEAVYPGLSIDLRDERPIASPYAALLAIVIASDVANTPPPEVITSWNRLAGLFPAEDDMARGLLYNTMAIALVQAGVLRPAEELVQESMVAYQRAGSPYLVHCMLLHLADLAIRNSRMREAEQHLAGAEHALSASTLAFNSEHLILGAFKARIAYEEGRFEDCPSDVEPILRALLEGDSWPDFIANTAAHGVFSAFWQKGLPAALDVLEHCSLTLNRRHGAPQSHHFALIRIRLCQVARRHQHADAALQEYDANAPLHRPPQWENEVTLIRLRQRIVRRRDIESALQLADSLAKDPYLSPRQKITLSILQAHLRLGAGKDGVARRHLTVALRIAEAEHLIGVLFEEGQFLERLLPLCIRQPHAGDAAPRAFARQVQRRLQALPSAPSHAKRLAGVSRQEHQVLCHLSDGNTNKEIARALGLSQSTVKFHLRSLFRKLRVSSRLELLHAAHERGIAT